ncbi:hypothetical protein [Streptomyces collinus]|uniref:hypothetical protein n=1 Tax=Streptomyces collinus TaxID=42684 RepID=UPI0033EEC6F5
MKFPTGALSAFLGVLLIRGALVPGLSDLDSRAQVLAWAAIFGAAQHLVTRLVDDRVQMTLSEVGKPTESVIVPQEAAIVEVTGAVGGERTDWDPGQETPSKQPAGQSRR